MSPAATRERPLIGWREWVALPELSEVPVKAKIDTGARTSALHAFDMKVAERDGTVLASFEVHPVQRSSAFSSRVEVPVASYRRVRSSTGHSELRPVIRTPIRLGGRQFFIDVTLTSRDEMGFRMLLGRAAVRRRYWVDPGRSYLHGTSPPVAKKRKKGAAS